MREIDRLQNHQTLGYIRSADRESTGTSPKVKGRRSGGGATGSARISRIFQMEMKRKEGKL